MFIRCIILYIYKMYITYFEYAKISSNQQTVRIQCRKQCQGVLSGAGSSVRCNASRLPVDGDPLAYFTQQQTSQANRSHTIPSQILDLSFFFFFNVGLVFFEGIGISDCGILTHCQCFSKIAVPLIWSALSCAPTFVLDTLQQAVKKRRRGNILPSQLDGFECSLVIERRGSVIQ